jgi:hypothetical protein
VAIEPQSGRHHLYFVFSNGEAEKDDTLMSLSSIELKPGSGARQRP